MRLLTLYSEYLITLAKVNSRPFRLPQNLNSLKAKNYEYMMFINLKRLLEKNNITQRETIRKFMESSSYYLDKGSFFVSNIVESYDEIIKVFDKKDILTTLDKESIRKSLNNLEDYCILNNVKSFNALLEGNPPTLVKLWRNDIIDDNIFVYLIDIEEFMKKKWFKIYCSSLTRYKVDKIKQRILDNEFTEIIDNNLKKLDRVFNV